MPPPELNLQKWRRSIARLRGEAFDRIAPTHFGIYEDPDWHLQAVERCLDEAERWLEHAMAGQPGIEDLRAAFTDWMTEQGAQQDLPARSPDGLRVCKSAGHVGRRTVPVLEQGTARGIASRDLSDVCHAEAVMHETWQEPTCPIY